MSYSQVFSTISSSTVKGGQHLKTLFRRAFKYRVSGGHSLIRLSRWMLFAVYIGLIRESLTRGVNNGS